MSKYFGYVYMKVAGQIKSVFLLWQGSLEVNLSNSDWFFLGRDFAILGNIDPRLFLYGPQANIPYNGTHAQLIRG